MSKPPARSNGHRPARRKRNGVRFLMEVIFVISFFIMGSGLILVTAHDVAGAYVILGSMVVALVAHFSGRLWK
jgi:hypothetical protein